MKIVPSGINGLDNILEGGFFKPAVVLVAGTAGAGKTTFTMQSLFNSARASQETCIYISTLSEPPAMITSYMSKFVFFDKALLEQKKLIMTSISDQLLKEGPEAVNMFIEEQIKRYRPDRVVIDPVTVLGKGINFKSESELRNYFFDLLIRMKAWNTLVILTGEFSLENLKNNPLSYLADGLIYLTEEFIDNKSKRFLIVLKMRGQKYLAGKHAYYINNDGITVYPRVQVPEIEKPIILEKISTGIKGLDEMLMGGLFKDSSVLISGGTGTGKTIFGMQFIFQGAMTGQPGLIISFEERPHKLKRNAKSLGWDFEGFEKNNLIIFLYFSPSLFEPDKDALKIKQIIEKYGIRRVFFDGTGNLETAIPKVIERRDYLNSLVDYFTYKGITSIFTYEIPELTGALKITQEAVSGSIDTIILLRHVEIKGEMKKALSIIKTRGSDHATDIREFKITGKGVEVKEPFNGFENILSGIARKSPGDVFREMFRKGD